MIAEIIAAGSEMLTPFRQDTNSLYLTDGLNDVGVQVAFKTIVGDNLTHLTNAASIAITRADIVIFSAAWAPRRTISPAKPSQPRSTSNCAPTLLFSPSSISVSPHARW